VISSPPMTPRIVTWTDPAVADLQSIQGYIAAMNPGAAGRVAQALLDAAESLSTFPMRGRSSGATRRLVVVAPYVIRYRVRPGEVVILRIRHGRRRRV
jgi:toxin ParE1/3/4